MSDSLIAFVGSYGREVVLEEMSYDELEALSARAQVEADKSFPYDSVENEMLQHEIRLRMLDEMWAKRQTS